MLCVLFFFSIATRMTPSFGRSYQATTDVAGVTHFSKFHRRGHALRWLVPLMALTCRSLRSLRCAAEGALGASEKLQPLKKAVGRLPVEEVSKTSSAGSQATGARESKPKV